jgi:hypothetical protein
MWLPYLRWARNILVRHRSEGEIQRSHGLECSAKFGAGVAAFELGDPESTCADLFAEFGLRQASGNACLSLGNIVVCWL